jgi:YVTN family beta-propeller protein
LTAPSWPAGTAPSGSADAPKTYVGLFKDDNIAVLDLVDNRVLRTVPIPPGPHGLVITPDGRKVYVSSDGASTVSVIDTRTDQVVTSLEVGPNPHGLAMSPDGRRVLVSAFGANQAMILDTASDTIIGQIAVPLPHNGAISPDGKMAYVGSQQQGATALVVLNLVNVKEVAKVALDKTPRGLDLSPDGRWLYSTVAGVNAVRVLDTASNQIVGEIPTGASSHVAVFAPKGHNAMAVSQGPGALEMFDPARHAVSGTVKVGQAPHWLAVSTDGRIAWVTNEGSDDVAIVDVDQRRVLATIPVGRAPRKIAVQPGAGIPPSAPGGRSGMLDTQGGADHGSSDARGQTVLTLTAGDYHFASALLRGGAWLALTLAVENSSGTLHNISVPALQIDQDILPRGNVNVRVTLPPPGVFNLFCKLHEALGMHGQLTVEATQASGNTP